MVWRDGFRLSACLLAALLFVAPAVAADATPIELRGRTLDGQAFDLAALRGKVVLVFFWSTDCAVCRSKLPELRLNAEGWAGKPFELVLVSVDRSRSDVLAYERTWALVNPRLRPRPALWRGEAEHVDTLPASLPRVPLSLLVDARGVVAERFEGRIPAEAWDRIAELLP